MGGPLEAGKALLARAVPSILPPTTLGESPTVHLAEAIHYRPRRQF
jgi:hypothetical protein